ncbi:MAG: TlpA disulfide reductase family protein [Acidobacteriota bacterium]
MGVLRHPRRGRGPGAAHRGLLAALVAVLGLVSLTPHAAAESIWRAEEWTDLEGHTWTAAELEGQVVLLDFWATWCPPCLAELPNLRKLHEQFGENGLEIVGVALDAIDMRDLRSFQLRHSMRWTQVHERSGTGSEIARRFGVEAVPVTVLVDRSGRVIARNLHGEALAAVIATLLPDTAPSETGP